ncbi:MAG: NAD(P)-binding domain-containing protein [Burkholderiaceae bacterium]
MTVGAHPDKKAANQASQGDCHDERQGDTGRHDRIGHHGSAMASNLQDAGFRVTGIDPDPRARESAASTIAAVGVDLSALSPDTRALVSSLPSARALAQVCEALIEWAQGAGPDERIVVAETSTLPLADKEQARDRLEAVGIGMVDAPLSGTAPRRAPVIWPSTPAGSLPTSPPWPPCSTASRGRATKSAPSATACA